MAEDQISAFMDAYWGLVFAVVFAVGMAFSWLMDTLHDRALARRIGPHVVGPNDRLYRVAKDTRLNGDVWYSVQRWGNNDWYNCDNEQHKTAEQATNAMNRRFDLLRSKITASREPVVP